MSEAATVPPRDKARPSIATARKRRARRRFGWAAFAVAVGIGALYLGDQGLARWQQHQIAQRKLARDKLDRMVLHYLRADVLDVAQTPEGNYRVTIFIENVYPEYDMYVLLPQVRTSAQVGPMWQEVPTSDPGTNTLRSGTVIKLTQRITFDRIFELPKDKEYFELLPGFYHVKFDNVMLVSPVPEPKEEIAERADNYFIHLLPVGADLDDIRRRNQFPGGKVPVYLPMPPH